MATVSLPGPLLVPQLSNFHDNGFLLLPTLLPPAATGPLLCELNALIDEQVSLRSSCTGTAGHWTPDNGGILAMWTAAFQSSAYTTCLHQCCDTVASSWSRRYCTAVANAL